MLMSQICLSIVTIGFSLACLPVHAQTYEQDLHDQSRWRGAGTQSQHQLGGMGMGMDGTSSFQQRREEDERDRREMHERQRRMAENFTNIPDQLREPYPRRANPPSNFR